MSEKRFIIPAIGDNDTQIIDSLPDEITLYDYHIEFKWKVVAEKKEDGITKNISYRGNKSIIKDKITCIVANYINDDEIYQVSVFASDDVSYSVNFKTFKEALEIKNAIIEWLKPQ